MLVPWPRLTRQVRLLPSREAGKKDSLHRGRIQGPRGRRRISIGLFSDKKTRAINHFNRETIRDLFGDLFEIGEMNHVSSVERDGVTRYFHEVLMNKPES